MLNVVLYKILSYNFNEIEYLLFKKKEMICLYDLCLIKKNIS